MPGNWSQKEVELIVSDYLEMLIAELKEIPFNKSDHRRELSAQLNYRSDGSIERKHQNISAILLEAGFPYVAGYKPLHNYQKLLAETVGERLLDQGILRVVAESVEKPAAIPSALSLQDLEVVPPSPRTVRYPAGKEPHEDYNRRIVGDTPNFLERETRNASLGAAGEQLIMDFEKERLVHAGKGSLSERVEQISRTRGPSAGFDILSFEPNGTDRLIEVKTTAYGKETPFYISRHELRTSTDHDRHYHLCRVFLFRTEPKMYRLRGRIDRVCSLEAIQYLARVG